jgi:RNA polymerase sigma factor (sigma-70 family)
MPAALASARAKLESFFPAEIEDVAVEALEAVIEKVADLSSVDGLKNRTISIAHNLAVSLLRERFAQKRGSGQTVSLDQSTDEDGHSREVPAPNSPLDALNQNELAQLLERLQQDLKPDHREALHDFFSLGLRYEEIAAKRGWAIGTVGVYLKRGMEAIRQKAEQHPKLLKELSAFLRLFLLL